jgi:hypothetical protein
MAARAARSPTRDAADAAAVGLGFASLDAFWVAHRRTRNQECATLLSVPLRWVRKYRPRRSKARGAPVAAPPRPPRPPAIRHPRDHCACGASKLVASRRCASCAARARVVTTPEALADALRRDPRPDADKLDARLTLLKMLWRQRTKRQRKAS